MKTVYLFSRCSTIQQALTGDSLQRQTRNTLEWIARDYPSWVVSDKAFSLEGVSGYDGSSLGLGGFLEACKSGEIVKGESVLAVEAPDRISRAEVSVTRQLWHTLQKDYGVDIAVQRWGIVFEHNTEMDLGNDLMLTAAFHLARMESEQKSHRIKATFVRRRAESREEGGKKRTSVCPAWLELNEDRSEFIATPKRAELLNRLFSMKLKQDKGPDRIARELNKEGTESFSGGSWSRTTIRKYLTDPKCIGTFQPQTVTKIDGKKVYTDEGSPIEGYYPCVVDPDTYWATQATFKNPVHGRKGRFTNLFKGITRCIKCQSLMSIKIAKKKGGIERLYLKCNKKGNGCDIKVIPYDQLEETLVQVFSMFDYSKLQSGHSTEGVKKEIEALKVKQAGIESQRDVELENASMATGTGSIPTKGSEMVRMRFIDRAISFSDDLEDIQKEVAIKQTQLMNMATSAKQVDLEIKDYDSRQRFNNFLKQYVDVIQATKFSAVIHLTNINKSIMFVLGSNKEKLSKDIEEIYKNIQGTSELNWKAIGKRRQKKP